MEIHHQNDFKKLVVFVVMNIVIFIAGSCITGAVIHETRSWVGAAEGDQHYSPTRVARE